MGTQNYVSDSIGDVSLPDCLRENLSSPVKQCNLAYDQAEKQRKLKLQELEELRLEAYKNSRIYKKKGQARKEFQVDQKMLVFKYRLKLIAVELKDENTKNTFQINGHQIKCFHEGLASTVGEMESISLMEPAPLVFYSNKIVQPSLCQLWFHLGRTRTDFNFEWISFKCGGCGIPKVSNSREHLGGKKVVRMDLHGPMRPHWNNTRPNLDYHEKGDSKLTLLELVLDFPKTSPNWIQELSSR
ncbi:hypothetical protein CR513_20196, partial [Mucuna pruriens]